jgi:diguanylate cyclase (GGDEF)-like protein
MQETLYDRFRPFKPYDLILALLMLVLIAPGGNLPPLHRTIGFVGALAIFVFLHWVQRYVVVPTPTWQAIAVVSLNTIVIAVVLSLLGAQRHSLAFAMLNAAFATIAFGPRFGIHAAVLSVALLAEFDSDSGRSLYEWALILAILLAMVAILARVTRLYRDSLFDVVTQLRNHRYFQVRLREELARSRRHGRPTALLILDLDNFKRVNDQFGHAVGDQVLRDIGGLLTENARTTDVVCRYGGEELAVILPETALAEATQVAERLRVAVQRRQDPRDVRVTISAGVAVCPDHGIEADALIAAADTAMYQAKADGKNQVAVAKVKWPGEDHGEHHNGASR